MATLENNWRQKTLESLEKDYWGKPTFDSYLVRRTHEIRKLPLTDLTNDDITMMLRQNFSLDYIVPLAIDKLQADILAHGDAGSEGAMMDAMIKISADFWQVNKDHWNNIKKLLDDNVTVWTFKRDSFDDANPTDKS
jgi:hypothetical protein